VQASENDASERDGTEHDTEQRAPRADDLVEREWERVGQVPNVVFVEGMVRDGDRWLFYYGGADKYVGVASAPLSPPRGGA